MAVIETWFEQDLQKPVSVRYIDGNLFSHNGNGNRIGVRVTNNGNPVTLSGTATGYVVTSDGSTVPCTGTVSGSTASILIPAAAYQPGSVCISLFLTDGSTVTTLASVATSVIQTRTGTQIDPGTVITDWTNTINAAMQAVVDANAANMARAYSSLTFPVPLGAYCLYENLLYRCISPITTSETFTAAHWTRAQIADDVAAVRMITDQKAAQTDFNSLRDAVGNVDHADVITPITVPARTSGAISGSIGYPLNTSASSQYYYVTINCNADALYTVTTYTSTSQSYTDYVYELDSAGVIIATHIQRTGTAGTKTAEIHTQAGTAQLAIMDYGSQSHIAVSSLSRTWDDLQTQIDEKAGNVKTSSVDTPVTIPTPTDGGVRGEIGETPTTTSTTSYKYVNIAVEPNAHYSVTLFVSASTSYPHYIWELDSAGVIVAVHQDPLAEASLTNCTFTTRGDTVRMIAMDYGTAENHLVINKQTVSFVSLQTQIDALTVAEMLTGKKWAVLGDSFSNGATSTTISGGKYNGKRYVYPYLIGNRTGIEVLKFFGGGRTLAYPQSGDFANSVSNPNADFYYQNIPADVDYITIYLGINDFGHRNQTGPDGEDYTGYIPLGTITDNNTYSYYGAWNVILTWLRTNRPFAHLGIIVTNGTAGTHGTEYRQAQLDIAKKYGVPYIDMNGDRHTPVMIRSCNEDIPSTIRDLVTQKQAVDYDGSQTGSVNTHPNDATHLFESFFIEAFLRSL